MRFTSCCVAALFAATFTSRAGAQGQEVVAVPSVHPFDLTPAMLQDEPPVSGALAVDDWRGELIVWFWLSGIEGDVSVRALTADISADFGDILDASDSILAFSGRLEVGKGRWGLFVDGLYSDLGADDQSGPVGLQEIDATFETSCSTGRFRAAQ